MDDFYWLYAQCFCWGFIGGLVSFCVGMISMKRYADRQYIHTKGAADFLLLYKRHMIQQAEIMDLRDEMAGIKDFIEIQNKIQQFKKLGE